MHYRDIVISGHVENYPSLAPHTEHSLVEEKIPWHSKKVA
jgi:hypothetical protein